MKIARVVFVFVILAVAISFYPSSPPAPRAELSNAGTALSSDQDTRRRESPAVPREEIPLSPAERMWQIINELTDLPKRHGALRALAVEMVKSSPEEAADLANQIFTNKGHLDGDAHAFVMGYASSIVSADPKAAAEWSKALPQELKLAASNLIAREWAKVDLAGVMEWSSQILDYSLRTSIITGIAGQLESADEKTAAAWAQNLSKSDDARQHSKLIAHLWAKADPAATFQWTSELPEGSAKSAAFLALAETLAEKEPRLAGEWVEHFPSGEFRDQAILATAQNWSNSDPQAAINWMTRLNDQRLLDLAAPGMVQQWLQKDKAAAISWIEASNLPEQLRNYLIQVGGGSPAPSSAK